MTSGLDYMQKNMPHAKCKGPYTVGTSPITVNNLNHLKEKIIKKKEKETRIMSPKSLAPDVKHCLHPQGPLAGLLQHSAHWQQAAQLLK